MNRRAFLKSLGAVAMLSVIPASFINTQRISSATSSGNWTHIAITKKFGSTSCYFDGNKVSFDDFVQGTTIRNIVNDSKLEENETVQMFMYG